MPPKLKTSSGLPARQQAFCDAYLTNGYKSKEAAVAAGYSIKSAGAQAANILAEERVKNYIDARLDKLKGSAEKKIGLTFEYKLRALKRIIEEFVVNKETLAPREVKVAITAIAEANKMQGHLAAQKMEVTNLDEDEDVISGRSVINITQINLNQY